MKTTTFFTPKRQQLIARIAMIAVLLALVRCISECFRLNAVNEITPSFETLKPFLLGSLVCAISVLIMTVLSFFQKNILIILTSALTITALVIIKNMYM